MINMTDHAYQQCMNPQCARQFGLNEVLFACKNCNALLDVVYDWSKCDVPDSLSFFNQRRTAGGMKPRPVGSPRGQTNPDHTAQVKTCGSDSLDFSGVWRFRELLPFARPEELITVGEGRTILQQADALARKIRFKPGQLFLQYEGFNPSGSFKDNGMAAAFTMARILGKKRVACASTGNTSASLAMFAQQTIGPDGQPMQAIVFVGGDKIAQGKLSQALDYGAKTIQINGDFDTCMNLMIKSAKRLDLYLMNSVNPFRLEGQKTIMYRVLEGLNWEVPDWIVVPGGNLGNSSAFGKAFMELKELGLIDRIPRLAIINANGANTLYELFHDRGLRYNDGQIDQAMIDEYFLSYSSQGRRAQTVASAIEIGRPVNLVKALRSLDVMNGVVRQVTDEQILDAKALVGRYGFGCEPASGATIAGLQTLIQDQIISTSDRVVCILTGHALKDADATVDYHLSDSSTHLHANPPVQSSADIDTIMKLLDN